MNRQIADLTTKGTLLITDLIPLQDAAKTAEAGKVTLEMLKEYFKPYTVYAVILTNAAGTFTSNVVENDYTWIAGGFTWAIASTGVLSITAAANFPFQANKTFSQGGTIIGSGGIPYHCIGARVSDTVFHFSLYKFDGTQATTPNFTNQLFEIRVY